MPLPPRLVCSEWPDWKNRSKTLGRSSAGIPIPLSIREMSNCFPSVIAMNWTSCCGFENFMALEIKLFRIVSSFFSSTCISKSSGTSLSKTRLIWWILAKDSKVKNTLLSQEWIATVAVLISSFPSSSFDKSRMSLTRVNNFSLLAWANVMSLWIFLLSGWVFISFSGPVIRVRGVLNSWEIFEKNLDFNSLIFFNSACFVASMARAILASFCRFFCLR